MYKFVDQVMLRSLGNTNSGGLYNLLSVGKCYGLGNRQWSLNRFILDLYYLALILLQWNIVICCKNTNNLWWILKLIDAKMYFNCNCTWLVQLWMDSDISNLTLGTPIITSSHSYVLTTPTICFSQLRSTRCFGFYWNIYDKAKSIYAVLWPLRQI